MSKRYDCRRLCAEKVCRSCLSFADSMRCYFALKSLRRSSTRLYFIIHICSIEWSTLQSSNQRRSQGFDSITKHLSENPTKIPLCFHNLSLYVEPRVVDISFNLIHLEIPFCLLQQRYQHLYLYLPHLQILPLTLGKNAVGFLVGLLPVELPPCPQYCGGREGPHWHK